MIFIGSCLYFSMAIWYINRFGDGAMVNRFDNFISDKRLGLISMFKTILVNPAYVLSQIAVKDKLIFFLQMLLPLGFLPLMARDWRKWTLVIPFVLINLMSNYKYQHSIFFQYTYGSGALLIYLAAVNFRDWKDASRPAVPVLSHDRAAPRPASPLPHSILGCGLACALIITSVVAYKKSYYIGSYVSNHEKAAEARLLLSSIPKDASVKSTTFFIPQLSGRDEIYLADSRHPADYIVLDQRPGYEKDSHALMAGYLDHGYGTWGDVDGYVTVLVSPQ